MTTMYRIKSETCIKQKKVCKIQISEQTLHFPFLYLCNWFVILFQSYYNKQFQQLAETLRFKKNLVRRLKEYSITTPY